MKYLRIAFAAAALLSLAGCANGFLNFNTKVIDPLITDISKINNTAGGDLVIVENVAKAATPPDTDGYNCAAAAITVNGQIGQVLTAANVTGAGALTTGELASLFQPGSQQYNSVKQTLTSGCAAKAQDVLGAAGVLAAGGVVGALAATNTILPLAAAAP
jgi:hypothetical protein